MGFLADWMVQTWAVVLEAAPWLVGGFFIAGLIHAWVRTDRIAAHLGRSNVGGVIKASLLGMPLPLCSCSVIPVASSIRRQGASRGATAGFLISTPETGVDSISLTYALLGPVMAVLRPVAALLSAIAAGVLINRFGSKSPSEPPTDTKPAKAACCHCAAEKTPKETTQVESASCHASSDESPDPPNGQPVGFTARLASAVRYGYGDMFADLAHWLVLGFALAGLVGAIVPAGFFEQYVGSGPLAMLAIVAVALPFYVCATSSTPIAAALIAKGLSPGTALVFLLVGPATNMTTMVVVARDLGRRSLVIYLLSIVVVAVVLGVGTDAILGAGAVVVGGGLAGHLHSESIMVAWPFALGLVLLMLNGLRTRFLGRRKEKECCAADAAVVPVAEYDAHSS